MIDAKYCAQCASTNGTNRTEHAADHSIDEQRAAAVSLDQSRLTALGHDLDKTLVGRAQEHVHSADAPTGRDYSHGTG